MINAVLPFRRAMPVARFQQNNVQFGYASYPPRDGAIFVSGSSTSVEKLPQLAPYNDVVRRAMAHLVQNQPGLRYKLITGGYEGIGQAATEGANGNSFVVSVKGWAAPIPNYRVSGNQFLYRQLPPVTTGLQRTDKMIQNTNVAIVAPGGIGTLEELSALTEPMYYKNRYGGMEPAPSTVILLDGPMPEDKSRTFWAPLLQLFNNMCEFGVSDETMHVEPLKEHKIGNQYVTVVNVNQPAEEAAKDIVQIITGNRPLELAATPQ